MIIQLQRKPVIRFEAPLYEDAIKLVKRIGRHEPVSLICEDEDGPYSILDVSSPELDAISRSQQIIDQLGEL